MNTNEQIAELEDQLSAPDQKVGEALANLPGPLLILGADGKMGPTLAWLAKRSIEMIGTGPEIIAVSRFGKPERREWFESKGIRTIACDLLDREGVSALPDAGRILYLAGKKFGTSENPGLTWSMNTLAPAHVCERYPEVPMVALSSGAVYPMVELSSGGSVETDPLTPPGEYANACIARERIFEYFSEKLRTPIALIRLNYAVEPRYGVLVDIALQVRDQQPIDLTMGYLNCIWQRDANAIILRSFGETAIPAQPLNLTGGPIYSVRDLANAFGRRFGLEPIFTGEESTQALLNNASQTLARIDHDLLDIEEMIARTADWLSSEGPTLGKPTHFEVRDGGY